MTFAENRAEDVTNVFLNTDDWGEPITYSVDGGSDLPINAVINRDIHIEYLTRSDGEYRYRESEMWISTSATDGVASPSESDTITFDTAEWNISNIGEKDGGMVKIIVSIYEPIEKSAEGHRREAN